jgi:hypothetical protein
MTCPHCSSSKTVRNGTAKGRQWWLCRDCGRSHIEPSPNPPHRPTLGDKPMSAAERMRRVRAKSKGYGATHNDASQEK